MKTSEEPLCSVVIPRYITRVKVSERRRARYYKKGGKKKIPQKYLRRLGQDYFFDKQGYLVDAKRRKVLSNPIAAGTPGYVPVSGNRVFSGFASPHTRDAIVKAVKASYARHILRIKGRIRPEDFPLRMEWEFHTTPGPANFDMSNFWIYLKCFEDSLTDLGIIPDDSVQYITMPARPIFFPVDDFEDRKFVFHFFRDEREIIRNHKLWKPDAATPTQL